jgi:hypothetical protein
MSKRVFVVSAMLCGVVASGAWADDKVDFEKQIQPILVEQCGKCHGEKQASAKMRLHTAAGLKEKWDAKKELIVAGDPEKSEFYQRLVLPADDKKRMPKKPAEPLAKEKIDLIAKWIREGAVLPAVAAPAPDAAKPAEEKPEAEKKEEKPAEAPLPEVAAAPKEAIDALTAGGAQVLPLFADSSLLTVSFAHRSEPATDKEVALLAGVAEQVYALNLADSKVSDAGLAPVARLKNLNAIHLERTPITDAAMEHLKGLAGLQYLNVYGTAITDAGLAPLKGLKNLRRLYLWQTKVSYDAAMGMEKDTPGLMVNLGYDHPMVAKIRLTKELELVKKQAEEAKADEAKAQQQLEAAKKNNEATTARLAETEKQLKEAEAALDPAKAAKLAEEKAAAEKAAAEKAAADKAAADKAAADKAAADKAAADKAAADKAAADIAAAEAKAKEEKK